MKYSFNRDKTEIIFAHAKDINSSYKDLCAVCDAIRYRNASIALMDLEAIMNGDKAVYYRTNNKGMGSRHELGGKKGRYPMRCAAAVKKVLVNAMANARNKGFEPDIMFVIHASANKTEIAQRSPSKGVLFMGAGYGYATARKSNLELAKIEIGLAKGSEKGLSDNMKKRIKAMQAIDAANAPKQKAEKQLPKKAKPKEQKQPVTTEQPKERRPQPPKIPKRPKEGLPQKEGQ